MHRCRHAHSFLDIGVCCVPGTVLHAGDSASNKTGIVSTPVGLHFGGGVDDEEADEKPRKQNTKVS